MSDILQQLSSIPWGFADNEGCMNWISRSSFKIKSHQHHFQLLLLYGNWHCTFQRWYQYWYQTTKREKKLAHFSCQHKITLSWANARSSETRCHAILFKNNNLTRTGMSLRDVLEVGQLTHGLMITCTACTVAYWWCEQDRARNNRLSEDSFQ